MKAFAMIEIGKTGWIEKEEPKCGPLDAVVKPICIAPCTSDIHTVFKGAIGERHNMVLGHECVGVVHEVGELVSDFKPGDKVIVPAITPDWGTIAAQEGFPMHSKGMLSGRKFSNYKDGDLVDTVMKLTKNHGVDRVIIAGGDNETFSQAVKAVKPIVVIDENM